jgi:predicted transcriptional regulator
VIRNLNKDKIEHLLSEGYSQKQIAKSLGYSQGRISQYIKESKIDKELKNYYRNNTVGNNFKHGESSTRLYEIWIGMKKRCFNKKHKSYKKYGKRGITICNEWRDHFDTFKDWSHNNGYKENLEIDRKNNDGNYEPDNCRWVTNQQNLFNKGCYKNKSGYKGVSWYPKYNKWLTRISKNKQRIFVGYFESKSDAAKAYNEKAKELFGEYAHLNMVTDE